MYSYSPCMFFRYVRYDGTPSFSDFQPFGGWRRPALKQFDDNISKCGVTVDLNYY